MISRITSRSAPSHRKKRGGIAIALHGGAGVIERSKMSPQMERQYREGLAAALEAGHSVLTAGGSSLDAVAAAVVVMEDSPLFNAGRGAAFTAEGKNELDAAIMDGATLRAGAVTLVTTVKNPVLLARLVMEKTRHVMLAGHGAEALAREHGLETAAPGYFFTERRWEALQRILKAQDAGRKIALTESERHGTVGAVALDRDGNLAAATSTGGYTNKMAGRVGDTPIIGAGTYANNGTAAVSCTGVGEYFMRTVAAHSVSMLMELKGWSVERAAGHVVRNQLVPLGGGGGLIAVDRAGHIVRCMSGAGLYYAHRQEGSPSVVAIYPETEAGESVTRATSRQRGDG
jgi:beta-aspartyl-peptidase (threonine type)